MPVARPAGQPGESPESKARGGANLPRKEAKHFGTGTGLSAVEETAEPETGTPTGRKSGSKGPLAGRHILLVEDTVLLRKLATTILTKVGATVYPVENGRQVRGDM